MDARDDPSLNVTLLDDLARRLGADNLLQWLEERTAELARLGWDQRGWVELNDRLLGAAGVTRVERDSRLPALACIRPLSSGSYGVYHRPAATPNDLRFWIAHEIAHTFWYKPGGGGVPLSPFQRCLGVDFTLEWLCNRAAAALLLPGKLLKRTLQTFKITPEAPKPPLHLIPGLASMHRVPPRMLTRRWLHEIVGRDLAIVCCRFDEELGEENADANTHTRSKPMGTQRMTIVWDAVPRGVAPRVRCLRGRRVPLKNFHHFQDGATVYAEVDGRWRDFLFALPKSRTAFRYDSLPAAVSTPAYVARTGNQVIIAVPRLPEMR